MQALWPKLGQYTNVSDVTEIEGIPQSIYQVEILPETSSDPFSTLSKLPPPLGATNKQVHISKQL